MNNKFSVATCITAVVILSGCQTSPKVVYTNANYPKGKQQIKYDSDDARCTAYSHGSIPMPQVLQAPTNNNAPTIKYGTFNADTRHGPISGSYTEQSLSTGSFGAGFMQGLSQGGNFFDRMDAQNARKKLYRACMSELGWKKKEQTINHQLVQRSVNEQKDAVSVLSSMGFSNPTYSSDSESSIFMIDRSSIQKTGNEITAQIAVIYAKTRSSGLLSNTFYSLNKIKIKNNGTPDSISIMTVEANNYDINNEVIFSRKGNKFTKLSPSSVYGSFFNLPGKRTSYLKFTQPNS